MYVCIIMYYIKYDDKTQHDHLLVQSMTFIQANLQC